MFAMHILYENFSAPYVIMYSKYSFKLIVHKPYVSTEATNRLSKFWHHHSGRAMQVLVPRHMRTPKAQLNLHIQSLIRAVTVR